jgi:hypothetical protein
LHGKWSATAAETVEEAAITTRAGCLAQATLAIGAE